MNLRIKELIHPNIANISLSILVAFLLWIRDLISPPESTPLLSVFNFAILNQYASWVGLIVNIVIAGALFLIVEKYSFLQQRTFLPLLLFLLLSGCYPHLHFLSNGLIASIFLILCIWQILSAFHKGIPINEAFNAGMFLSLGYYFCFEFIFIIPLIFITLYIVNNLSLRVFLSGILGILTPALLIFGISFWFGSLNVQTDYFMQHILFDFSALTNNIPLTVIFGLLTLMSLIAAIGCFQNRFNSGISERKNQQVIVFFYFGLTGICWLKFNDIVNILPSFLMISTFIFSILFSTKISRLNTILSVALIILQVVTLILGYSGILI